MIEFARPPRIHIDFNERMNFQVHTIAFRVGGIGGGSVDADTFRFICMLFVSTMHKSERFYHIYW